MEGLMGLVCFSAGTRQLNNQRLSLGKAWYSLGTRSCWKSPNLNHFDIKHIASLKEAILEDFIERVNDNVDGDFLHLATALDPRRKVLQQERQEGVLAQAESRA